MAISLPTSVPRTRLFKIPFPMKGVNTSQSSFTLPPDYTPFSVNARFTRGEVQSIPDTASHGSGMTGVVNGAFSTQDAGGIVRQFAATKSGLFIYAAGLTPAWVNYFTTGGTFFTGQDEDFWSFTNLFDEIYASTGIGGVIKTISGGAGDVVTTNYAPRFLESFAGRLMMAHLLEEGQAHGDRVRWSAANDGSQFDFTVDSTAGAVDLVDVPGPITGMRALNGQLYIHKRQGIIRMTETGLNIPSFAVQTAVDGVGAIADRTITNINGLQFFLGDDNIYAFDGSSLPAPIGEAVREQLFTSINWARIRTAWAVDYPQAREWWLFVPEGVATWPGSVYIYNYSSNTWSYALLPSSYICGAFAPTGTTPDTWGGGGGATDTWGGGSDNAGDTWGTPAEDIKLAPFFGTTAGTTVTLDEASALANYPASFDTIDTDLGNPGFLKTVERVRVRIRNRNTALFGLRLSTDSGVTWSTGTTVSTPSPVSETETRTILFPVARQTGEIFRFRLSTSDRFAILGLEAEVLDRAEVKV